MAFCLTEELLLLTKEFGLERLGFLTLTFVDNVSDPKEAQRRFNSLATNVLRKHYARVIAVRERQRRGAWHYHCLIVLTEDIRSGVNFDAMQNGDYRSAGAALKAEWRFWRETAVKYNFGRTELLPIKSNGQAIAKYVGKYVTKDWGNDSAANKVTPCNIAKIRRVSFIGFPLRHYRPNFQGANGGALVWRKKLAQFIVDTGAVCLADLRRSYGVRWAWKLRHVILDTDLPDDFVWPEKWMADEESQRKVARDVSIDRTDRAAGFKGELPVKKTRRKYCLDDMPDDLAADCPF